MTTCYNIQVSTDYRDENGTQTCSCDDAVCSSDAAFLAVTNSFVSSILESETNGEANVAIVNALLQIEALVTAEVNSSNAKLKNLLAISELVSASLTESNVNAFNYTALISAFETTTIDYVCFVLVYFAFVFCILFFCVMQPLGIYVMCWLFSM